MLSALLTKLRFMTRQVTSLRRHVFWMYCTSETKLSGAVRDEMSVTPLSSGHFFAMRLYVPLNPSWYGLDSNPSNVGLKAIQVVRA